MGLSLAEVRDKGCWGYRRYHEFIAGSGGIIEDTMRLYQGVVGL